MNRQLTLIDIAKSYIIKIPLTDIATYIYDQYNRMVFGTIHKKLQKGPPYVPLKVNLTLRAILIISLLTIYTVKKVKNIDLTNITIEEDQDK